MRVDTEQRTFETNIDAAPSSFKIQASAKMFQILSSGLYSNKALAIVRELTANAIDAHVAAGTTDTPFEIHFPTSLEPWFEIKDYGTGLSDEDIRTLYCTYGESNKTETDELIGGFGLGSKSPFAYTDQFTVTSRHGGMKRAYSIFIAADGTPQIMKVSEEPTSEHSGLTVNIGVALKDRHDFSNVAEQVLPYVEKCAFTVNINVKRPEYTLVADLPGTGAQFRARKDSYHDQTIYVIQGSVRYSTSEVDCPELKDWLPGVDVYVPIGTLDIAVNRETLAYTERTRKWFAEGAKVVADVARQKIEQDLAGFDNLINRAKYLLNLSHYHSPLSRFIKDEHFEEITQPAGVELYKVESRWRRGRTTFEMIDVNNTNYRTTRAFSRMLVEQIARKAYASERKTWVKPHVVALNNASSAPVESFNGLVAIGPIALVEQFYTSMGVDFADVSVAPKPIRKPRAASNGVSLAGQYFCATPGDCWHRKPLTDAVTKDTIYIVDRDRYDDIGLGAHMGVFAYFGLLTDVDGIILVSVPKSHNKVRKELIEEYDAEVIDLHSIGSLREAITIAMEKFNISKQALRDKLIELAPTDVTMKELHGHSVVHLRSYTQVKSELRTVLDHYAPEYLQLVKAMLEFFDRSRDQHGARDNFFKPCVLEQLSEQDKQDINQARLVDVFRTQVDAITIKHGAWVWSIAHALSHWGDGKAIARIAEAAFAARRQLQEQTQCNTPISSLETPSLSTLAA